jgi:hypothetical protein
MMRALGWLSAVLGLLLLILGVALRHTGIMGEAFLVVGGYAVVQGALLLLEVWWRGRGGST